MSEENLALLEEIRESVAKGESFTRIAQRHDLSRERIRQLARAAGVKLEDWLKLARQRRTEAIQSTLPEDYLRLVWDEALRHGLVVKRALVRRVGAPRIAKKRELLINGHTCAVSRVRYRTRVGNERAYGIHSVGTTPRDFQIFVNSVPGYPRRIFIIPQCAIKGRWQCIPLKKLPVYKNRHPRVDWWSYEDAWHLLEKKKD